MSRIQLLLADVPPMLGEIVAMLAEDPRLAIVGRVGRESDLDDAVRASGADVVLVSERMAPLDACAAFLRRHPRVRLLTLLAGGERARLCELVPHELEMRDVSPQELVAAILGEPRSPA